MAEPLTETQLQVWRAFLLMRRQLDLTLERRLQADAGISAADYEILAALAQAPDQRLRAGHVADLIGWEKSRVSHQISRMCARGLVRREECDDDARGVWVVIDEPGIRAAAASQKDRALALREHFFDVVTPQEQELLRELSQRVLDSINPSVCDDETVSPTPTARAAS